MKKTQKVVCCCHAGQIRSVATRKILHEDYGFWNVLAAGMFHNSSATLEMLFVWADHIIIVGERFLYDKVPKEFKAKTIHLDIGGDVWGNAFDKGLRDKLRAMINDLKIVD